MMNGPKSKPTGLRVLTVAALALVGCATAIGQPEWPLEIEAPTAAVTMYQPQLETFEGDKLTARAAVAVKPKGDEEAVFGAVWMAARVATDRDTRVVTLQELEVTDAKFPHATPDQIGELKALLEKELPKGDTEISLDHLLTMLELVEKEQAAAEDLKTDPPRIIHVTQPTVLVTVDGEPRLKEVGGGGLMRVVNTPFFIVLDAETKAYYLRGGGRWYTAPDIAGPWAATRQVPTAAVELLIKEAAEGALQADAGEAFDVLVSTEPTELIVSDGDPEFTPIRRTGLLYMTNTDSDVLMDIGTQQRFVLLAGRWYSAESMDGPWTYMPPDSLPDDFADIPPASAKGHVLAHVAGTQQATDAVNETYIPQTAVIDRKAAKLTVAYDGDPEFESVEGTKMQYAVNTANSVILVEGRYYCCHEGVWFVAAAPTGPWTLCTSVPPVIYTVPPSCPVYNVRYVYIYDYTPEVIYVGYLPGYVGCYVYHGVVVYGTGWHYRHWAHHHYYPRPHTWGFAVRYNPVTGNWGFAVGHRGPHGWIGFGTVRRGWWGVGGFRDVDIDIDRNINIDVDRSFGGDRRDNLYTRRENRDRIPERHRPQDRPRTPERGGRAGIPEGRGRANDAFADRSGNVHRKTTDGWQRRQAGGWSKPSAQPAAPARTQTSLNRHSSARSRGASRTSSFRSSRSSGGSRSRGGRGR